MAFFLASQLLAQANPCEAVGDPNVAVNLGDCLRLGNNQPVSSVYEKPTDMVNLIVKNVFVFAGIVIFLLIFYAGFKMISGGKKGFDEAKSLLTSAVIGLIIMICAYWIVQLVGYLTGVEVALPVL